MRSVDYICKKYINTKKSNVEFNYFSNHTKKRTKNLHDF